MQKKYDNILLKIGIALVWSICLYFFFSYIFDLLVEKLTLSQSSLIIDSLKVLISFPTALLIAILLFKEEIRDRILNIKFTKVGNMEAEFGKQGKEVSEAQDQIEKETKHEGLVVNDGQIQVSKEALENIAKDFDSKDNKIKEFVELASILQIRAQKFEFAFLSQYLVTNSRLAIRWCKKENRFKKKDFLNNYILPVKVRNEGLEKEVIFDTLVDAGLIQKIKNEDFTISVKGVRFLEFIGLKAQ
ncbi:hypothetical protein K8R14_03980 [bacterium]|nr:hypothetical protein [bacterium]